MKRAGRKQRLEQGAGRERCSGTNGVATQLCSGWAESWDGTSFRKKSSAPFSSEAFYLGISSPKKYSRSHNGKDS